MKIGAAHGNTIQTRSTNESGTSQAVELQRDRLPFDKDSGWFFAMPVNGESVHPEKSMMAF